MALWLAAAGRPEELTAFVAARRFAAGEFATSVEGGRVRALFDAAPKDVPDTVLTLGAAETPLRARVQRARVEDDALHLELFVGVRRVESESPTVQLRLVEAPSLDLPAEVSSDPAVTRWMAEPHQRHHEGVVRTRIPLAAIGSAPWHLEIELDDRGVRRTGTVSGELPSTPDGVLVGRFELGTREADHRAHGTAGSTAGPDRARSAPRWHRRRRPLGLRPVHRSVGAGPTAGTHRDLSPRPERRRGRGPARAGRRGGRQAAVRAHGAAPDRRPSRPARRAAAEAGPAARRRRGRTLGAAPAPAGVPRGLRAARPAARLLPGLPRAVAHRPPGRDPGRAAARDG